MGGVVAEDEDEAAGVEGEVVEGVRTSIQKCRLKLSECSDLEKGICPTFLSLHQHITFIFVARSLRSILTASLLHMELD